MIDEVLAGYAAAASDEMIARYEAMSSTQIYEPVLDLLPTSPCRVLDIGAGTGRDARWLAGLGHRVSAVEPVQELIHGREANSALQIEWLSARLPGLEGVAGQFDLLTLCGVWQHLEEHQRPPAMASLRRLTAAEGRVVLYLRHGPGAPGRPVWPIVPEATIGYAMDQGFRVLRQRRVQSVSPENRAAGVDWTWLVLEC
ncbi:MAG: methyltransferase domain-containing protein [Vulcanimicrobiota bacterium]